MEIALAMEAAAKDALELQGGKESAVNKINTESERLHSVKPKPPYNCSRCGGTTHESSKGYFKNETCRKCGKLGHIQRV